MRIKSTPSTVGTYVAQQQRLLAQAIADGAPQHYVNMLQASIARYADADPSAHEVTL